MVGLPAWSDYEVPKTRSRLKDIPDGSICTLSCGCVIQRMTLAPRTTDLINVWIQAPCDCMRKNYSTCTTPIASLCLVPEPVRKLRNGVLSAYLASFTAVDYDPLASALSEAFRCA